MKRTTAILLAVNLLALSVLAFFIAIPRSIELEGTVGETFSYQDFYQNNANLVDVPLDDLKLTHGLYFHSLPLGVMITANESEYKPAAKYKISCLVWGFDQIVVRDCRLKN